MTRAQTCCFTGHRPEALAAAGIGEADVRELLARALEREIGRGYRRFLCGACRGADFWFGEEVVRLRARYPQIRLICVLPCRTQADLWPLRDRERYRALLSAADEVVCLQEEYTQGCMHARNRYLVDRSSLLLAVYTGAAGGTRYTVNYAQRKGLRVIRLPEEVPEQVCFEASMPTP